MKKPPPPPQVYVYMYDVRGKPPYNDPIQAARRKPSGVILREAMHDYREAARHGVLYVGDRPEDRATAVNAGVTFQWAHIFFGA
jgi:histidinol phosphatase-like enzyme